MLRPLTDSRTAPFTGGAITYREKALLPFGAFSWIQNMRSRGPGFYRRLGQRRLHTVADGTNEVLNLYEYIKSRVTEQRFYAQMDDGDLLEATNLPPAVTTGAFGSAAHAGSVGQIPASFATIVDLLLYSNGVDQHQIYGGSNSYVENFIVWDGSAALSNVPTEGRDYSVEVSDGRAATVAVLDALDTFANNECIFIGVPIKFKSVTVTVSLPNGSASVLSGYYRKNDNTWAALSGFSDGTTSGGATLAQNGTISWTVPSDWKENYMFSQNKFWIRLQVSAQLDAEVEVSSVTYDSDFQDIVNIWDGIPQEVVEVRLEISDNYETHPGNAADMGSFAAGNKCYLFCTDPIEGIYADPGATPNAIGVSLSTLRYWDGTAFSTVGTAVDDSAGLSRAGWITFPRQLTTPPQPRQFQGSQYYSYIYELTWDTAFSADTVVDFTVMPYFDIDELGDSYTCCAWKDLACYTFTLFGSYIYVAKAGSPMVLNGDNFGILKAGDGRANRIVGMRKFHNELMVWQEEKGVEGGCVTLFEGYSPQTFGKLILSSQIGAFNAKCMVVVDGVLTSTRTDESVKTIAFWLSRYGLCASDGRTVQIISDDIQNYWDPKQPESIRRGYDHKHWLAYDSSDNVLRMGLVTGDGATEPNVFPVFDLAERAFCFDTPAQEIGCMTEISAGSGDTIVLQVGGGVDDGTVYQLNHGTLDVDQPIDSYCDSEFSLAGQIIQIQEIHVRAKAQVTGDVDLSIYRNGILDFTLPLSMIPATPSEDFVRHLIPVNVTDHHISIRLRNGNRDEDIILVDMGLRSFIQEMA